MDFHSLARKELQALCKKNKIPANMTNAAMADALNALQLVEGLEEFLNPSETNDISEKTESGSPDIPRTASRTSTRRKPVKEEAESTQPLTRTRRGTRAKTAEGIDQENKDVNVQPITPAMPSTRRRRAPAASACRNIETQLKEDDEKDDKINDQETNDVPETPAVASSRRRVPASSARRKVETQMMESSVQRAYSTRRSVRMLEKNMAKLSMVANGADPIGIDELSGEMTNGSERSEVSVEVEKDMSGSSMQTMSEVASEKTDHSEVSSDLKSNESLDYKSELKVDVQDKKESVDVNDVGGFKSKQEMCAEISDNSDVFEALVDESHNEVSDESDAILSEKSDKAIDVEDEIIDEKGPADVPEDENSIPAVEPEIEKDTGAEEGSLAVVSNDVSAQVLDHVIATQSLLPEENNETYVAEGDEHGKYESDEYSSEEITSEFQEYIGDDAETEQKDLRAPILEDKMVSQTETETEADDFADQHHGHSLSTMAADSSEEITSEFQEYVGDDAETEQKDLRAPILEDKMVSQTETETEADDFADQHHGHSLSTMAADSVSGQQFAADQLSFQFPRPAQLTPRKSSDLKQSTIQKMIDVSDAEEENIDNGSEEVVDIEKDNVRQDENTVDVDNMLNKFAGMSLRQLKKKYKELKKNGDKIVAKDQVGKTRIALQALPENRMTVDESGKEN